MLFCCFFDSPGHCLRYSSFYFSHPWDFQIGDILLSSLLHNLVSSQWQFWFSALVNNYYPSKAPSSLLPGTVPTCLTPAMWNSLHFLTRAFFHLSILIYTLVSSWNDSPTSLPGSCLPFQGADQVSPSRKHTLTTLWNYTPLVDASIVHCTLWSCTCYTLLALLPCLPSS